MADVYRTKVEQLAEALQTDDGEQREAARSGLRALITKIVVPPGDGLLHVFGNLGQMVATAASGRDASTLAGVAQSVLPPRASWIWHVVNLFDKRHDKAAILGRRPQRRITTLPRAAPSIVSYSVATSRHDQVHQHPR
jgi:hypothetical protein